MKSINAKKIAAVTAGAVLLGASLLAAAPVMYGNTEIINSQGKPVVKVVVGANARASDGVAAANIAAVIGSLAYKDQTVSAQLSGTPTCNVTAGGAAGSCSVSDKKVTLEITTPGTAVAAGSFGFKSYIYGYVDSSGTSEDNQLRDGNYKSISGDNFVSFADFKSSVSSVSGEFTTKQYLYLQTTTAPLFSTTTNKYEVSPSTVIYNMTFDHSTYAGIPSCTLSSVITGTNTSFSGVCTPADTYKIDRLRLKVRYLGEDWIVSEMSPPAAASTGTSYIKLAKESTPATIVYAGQNISAGVYTIKLADLTIPYGSVDSQAVIQIYDANKQLVKEDTVTSTSSKEITLPNGDKVTIRVFKTAPGLTTAKWAEMSVFSQELTLNNGQLVDSDKNKNWSVTLNWGTSSGGTLNWTLKGIQLTKTTSEALVEGGNINVIESPNLFQVNLQGVSLTDAQRDTLNVDLVSGIGSYYETETATTQISAGIGDRDYICVTSGKKAFAFAAAPVSSDDRSKICFGMGNNTPLLYDKPDKGYVRYVPTATATVANVGTLDTAGTAASNPCSRLINGTAAFNVSGWNGAGFSTFDSGLFNNSNGGTVNLALVKNYTATGSGVNYLFRMWNASNATEIWSVTAATNTTLVTAGAFAVCDRGALYVANFSAFPNQLTWPFDVNQTVLTYNVQDSGSTENGFVDFRDQSTFFGVRSYVIGSVSELLNKVGGSIGTTYGNLTFWADPSSLELRSTSNSSNKVTVSYLSTAGANTSAEKTSGFVTQRGSVFRKVDTKNFEFGMAKKLGELQYILKTAGTNVTAGTSTNVLAEGQQVSVQDSTVKVKSISQTVGACSVSGGSSGCSADKGTMKAVLDTGAASAQFAVPYKFSATDRLVVLDSEAPTAETLVLVGGPMVNTVTSQAISGQQIKFAAGDKPVVKAVTENRIVVAGYSAADTTAAASQFISELLAKVA